MVSAVFRGERVDAIMMRWERESRDGEVRNSSMRRSQVARPSPLENKCQVEELTWKDLRSLTNWSQSQGRIAGWNYLSRVVSPFCEVQGGADCSRLNSSGAENRWFCNSL